MVVKFEVGKKYITNIMTNPVECMFIFPDGNMAYMSKDGHARVTSVPDLWHEVKDPRSVKIEIVILERQNGGIYPSVQHHDATVKWVKGKDTGLIKCIDVFQVEWTEKV